MRLRLHRGAVDDLISAGDWYEGRRTGLGLAFEDEIQRAIDLIAETPETWPRWPDVPRELNVRRFLLTRFPFALAYIVRQNEIIVLAIAHLKRRPSYWLSRID